MSVITKSVPKILRINGARFYSSAESVKRVSEDLIKKSVFISQSKDIYTNLALEDWFYKNSDFNNQHVLLLWKNDPCVVIGRHQNPWIEANVPELKNLGVKLARRNSGGGTVYHDQGNLNFTFFTPKERYDRGYNLNIITRALFREWGLKTIINKREDIIVQGEFKVSGTAAKLGRPNAYHHCTLLVNANKQALHLALKKKEMGIEETNATESIKSPIKNLQEVNAHVNTDRLLNAVGWEYLRTKALTLEDGGHKLLQEQKGFQMINPTEDWFPGIDKLREDICSWDWIYGKTPKFTVARTLLAPPSSSTSADERYLKLTILVQHGIVEDIKLSLPLDITPERHASVITSLRGAKFNHGIVDDIVQATGCKVVASEPTVNLDQSGMAATQ